MTDPRTLENARLSLDRIIKFGDASAGINPNAIAPQDYAATNVRAALSAALKKQIPGYEDLMGRYSNIYSMLDANEQGANIFGKGINSLRPDQVAAMAADPVTGPAFKAGARAAVEGLGHGVSGGSGAGPSPSLRERGVCQVRGFARAGVGRSD